VQLAVGLVLHRPERADRHLVMGGDAGGQLEAVAAPTQSKHLDAHYARHGLKGCFGAVDELRVGSVQQPASDVAGGSPEEHADGDELVSGEADDACGEHPDEVRGWLRVDQAHD
jgi:hypothetical protein